MREFVSANERVPQSSGAQRIVVRSVTSGASNHRTHWITNQSKYCTKGERVEPKIGHANRVFHLVRVVFEHAYREIEFWARKKSPAFERGAHLPPKTRDMFKIWRAKPKQKSGFAKRIPRKSGVLGRSTGKLRGALRKKNRFAKMYQLFEGHFGYLSSDLPHKIFKKLSPQTNRG